jgi:Fur family transcriptional regulator, zinc uptake regulator
MAKGPDNRADHYAHAAGGHCQHGVDQLARAEAMLERAERRCRSSGARLTPVRRAVLSELLADYRPLGAYDLVERVSLREGRRLAPISVYRALDFLVEVDAVHRLSSRNAFIACPHEHPPGEPVAFLICDACGGVDELASPAIASALAGASSSAGFRPSRQMIELSGLCGHCQEVAPVAHPGKTG